MLSAHKDAQRQLVEILKQMRKHKPADQMEETLLLQCEVAWNIVNCIRLLSDRKQGVAAMILCRSIFERTAAMDLIANSTDPQLLTDYIDYGKVIAYEVADALSTAPVNVLAGMKPEYDMIKARLKNKPWHKSKIEYLVAQSFDKALLPGEKSLYKSFYKEASSFAHGDSFLVLRHRPKKGWHQVFDPEELADWAVEALSMAYQYFASMLFQVQIRANLGLEADFEKKLIPILEKLPTSA